MSSLERIKKIAIKLSLDHIFYGFFLLDLEFKKSDSISTACTDGESIMFNMNYMNSLTTKQVATVLIHEIKHIMLEHHLRLMPNMDLRIANKAMDYVINYSLIYEDGMEPIDGMLLNAEYKDDSWEIVYKKLLDEKKQQPQQQSQSGIGDVIPAPPHVKRIEESSKIKEKIIQATKHAEKAGKLPEYLKRDIKKLLEPEISWERQIAEWMDDKVADDYDWRKRDPRIDDWFFPTLESEAIGDLVNCIDVSSSINRLLLQKFLSELNFLKNSYSFNCWVLAVNTMVTFNKRYLSHEPIEERSFIGGGGTRFSPAFDWIVENTQNVIGIIYFTDLQCYDFGNPPYQDVLWVNYGREKTVPFGRVINIR